MIYICAKQQTLSFYENDQLKKTYPISTGLKGLGEVAGSEQTPRGLHQIRAKIGEGMPIFTVFKGRRPTGETYSEALLEADPKRDFILTRILWLSGLEVGRNRLGNVDTFRRFIYIHGACEKNIGTPASHGCIRMMNQDIIELFSSVTVGEKVLIA